ncbi:MAG: Fcf1-domain-containing protein [Linnemannia gamsii]|nr:MAG: Fcf1-domain-containing protein [Linnemannia gamsii]
MRLKRTKDYKRYMNMYCQTFHFRKPFQVLVDADFIQTALDQRLDLRTNIPKVLCDASKQMVTPCTMALLKSRGEDASGAFLASKRFEKRRCKHQQAVDEAICLSQIISNSNPHNYVVASQSKKLRSQFAQVPGVPLLYINRANLILEPPSDASMNKSKQIESGKTHASTKELATLKTVKVTGQGKVSIDAKAAKKLEERQASKKQKREIQKAKLVKKLGPKEPNPLSVKKKKKVAPTPAAGTAEKKQKAEGESAEGAPEKKKRKRRKSKSAGADQEAAGGNESS